MSDEHQQSSHVPHNGEANTPAPAEDRVLECERLRDEYLDGWKRAKADLANYKKEEMERFASLLKFANEGLIADLLAVLDSFDLGLVALDDQNPAKHGMRMIQSQFFEILKQQGLEHIGVSPGDQFDPAKHEAVGDANAEGPPGVICEEVSRGYELNGKVLRATKVILSKTDN